METFALEVSLTIILLLCIGFGVVIKLQTKKNFDIKKEMESAINRELSRMFKVTDNVSDYFSPKVLEVYRSILTNPNAWELSPYILSNENLGIEIWAANEVNNRYFRETKKLELDDILLWNKELTPYDKILLDKLIIALRERKEAIIAKFFI